MAGNVAMEYVSVVIGNLVAFKNFTNKKLRQYFVRNSIGKRKYYRQKTVRQKSSVGIGLFSCSNTRTSNMFLSHFSSIIHVAFWSALSFCNKVGLVLFGTRIIISWIWLHESPLLSKFVGIIKINKVHVGIRFLSEFLPITNSCFFFNSKMFV